MYSRLGIILRRYLPSYVSKNVEPLFPVDASAVKVVSCPTMSAAMKRSTPSDWTKAVSEMLYIARRERKMFAPSSVHSNFWSPTRIDGRRRCTTSVLLHTSSTHVREWWMHSIRRITRSKLAWPKYTAPGLCRGVLRASGLCSIAIRYCSNVIAPDLCESMLSNTSSGSKKDCATPSVMAILENLMNCAFVTTPVCSVSIRSKANRTRSAKEPCSSTVVAFRNSSTWTSPEWSASSAWKMDVVRSSRAPTTPSAARKSLTEMLRLWSVSMRAKDPATSSCTVMNRFVWRRLKTRPSSGIMMAVHAALVEQTPPTIHQCWLGRPLCDAIELPIFKERMFLYLVFF
eukprot:PhM_4_TR3190/c0_g1_i1/m.8031